LFYNIILFLFFFFFFSSRRRHTRWPRDWSSDVCSSDLSENSINIRIGEVTPECHALVIEFSLVRVLAVLVAANLGDLEVGLRARSEERRVGKECRSRWSADQ